MSLEKIATMTIEGENALARFHVSPRKIVKINELNNQGLEELKKELKNYGAYHLEKSFVYINKEKLVIQEVFKNGKNQYVLYYKNEPAEI